jgi:hypothetical protein
MIKNLVRLVLLASFFTILIPMAQAAGPEGVGDPSLDATCSGVCPNGQTFTCTGVVVRCADGVGCDATTAEGGTISVRCPGVAPGTPIPATPIGSGA